jgi:hypothetical protein
MCVVSQQYGGESELHHGVQTEQFLAMSISQSLVRFGLYVAMFFHDYRAIT